MMPDTEPHIPSWEDQPDLTPSRWERWAVIIFIRGSLAMGIGIVLELGFWMFFGLALGSSPIGQALLETESKVPHVITFIVFHILGWLITWHQWPVISGSVPDTGNPHVVGDNEFKIEHGRYIISGKVYLK